MSSASARALIGYSGFVGGTLLHAGSFDALYNSKNIADIAGRSFDLVVCAGVSAAKWLANKEPDADRAAIAALTHGLDQVEARELVLISTIDVYPDPSRPLDESHPIDPAAAHAYGRHRFELEQWVRGRFPSARIVRLPALFGEGLKKNALYDLLNDNLVGNIDPNAVFQWYPMRRLAGDLDVVRRADLRLVNLFTEPIAMSEIIAAFFPSAPVGAARASAPRYALRTRYAHLFGGADGHMMSKADVLRDMADYIATERRAKRAAPQPT
jgi:hypothetical protein